MNIMGEKLSFSKGNASRSIFVIFNSIFLIIVFAVILFPILKIVSDSLDQHASLLQFKLFPEKITFEAYLTIAKRDFLYRPFLVSVFVTTIGTFLSLFFTTLFAYALNQRMPGRKIIISMVLLTMVFRAGIIPLFFVVKSLGLIDNLFSILLAHCVDAYYLILLKNFFSSIPKSLMEAAEIDGCTPMKTFAKIVLPLSKAGLATIALFYLVRYWNQFFEYIIFINDSKLWNFQVMIRSLVVESSTQSLEGIEALATETIKNAVVVVSIIPVALVYPFLQKYFVKGVNIGAIKE